MLGIFEIIKVIFLGIVEGITEWLPISSTGHMILFDEFVKLNVSDEFKEMFFVVIQFGAIIAVIIRFWDKLWPFAKSKQGQGIVVKKPIINLWFHMLVSCVPAIIVGLPLDDFIDEHLYNPYVVAAALIIFGVAFIWVENRNAARKPQITRVSQIDYKTALIIGLFQLIAALFPGTSRSGATIVGALLLGVSRQVAAQYTFYLAVPVMAGASFLKLVKYGPHYSATEFFYLMLGMLVAFAVSWVVINFLMNYIKKHDFKFFGWYRIILGAFVLLFFVIKAIATH